MMTQMGEQVDFDASLIKREEPDEQVAVEFLRVFHQISIGAEELGEIMSDPATSPTLKVALLCVRRRLNEAVSLLREVAPAEQIE